MRWPIQSSLLLCLTCLPGMAGCWRYSRGDTDRLSSAPMAVIDASAWPPRDPEAVRPLAEATPGWIYGVCLQNPETDPASLEAGVRESLATPRYVVEYCGLQGLGLVRVYRERQASDPDARAFESWLNELVTGFVPNASFVSSRTLGDNPEATIRAQQNASAAANVSLRARNEPYEILNTEREVFLTAGVDIRFPPQTVTTVRGLILHLQSLGGNDYEPIVLNDLRARGWAIVDIKTATSVRAPVSEGDRQRSAALRIAIASLDQQIRDRNFGILERGGTPPSRKKDPLLRERTTLAAEMGRLDRGAYQVAPRADPEPVARQIAGDIDETLAGNAYAVEAVLDYVTKERRDLCEGPVVLMGFSAGALAAPTVAARLRDRIDGLVLIGGGADLFMISQRSTFTNGGVTVRSGIEKAPPQTIAAIDTLYLRHSRLDPYHTAPTLRNLPVLQVDATMDTWVPTAGNDLLWERLGRPDRLRAHLCGHMMLFYFLPSQSERIARWLEGVKPGDRH